MVDDNHTRKFVGCKPPVLPDTAPIDSIFDDDHGHYGPHDTHSLPSDVTRRGYYTPRAVIIDNPIVSGCLPIFCNLLAMSAVSLDYILIRPMNATDVANVRDLHSLLLPVRYPSSFFTQLLLFPGHTCLVACHIADAGRPIAFVSACFRQPSSVDDTTFLGHSEPHLHTRLAKSAPTIEILTLGVKPEFRKRGLASLLIRRVYQRLRESFPSLPNSRPRIQANVATSNTIAISFYEKLGLHIVPEAIFNLYPTCSYGSRDAYLVSGYFHL